MARPPKDTTNFKGRIERELNDKLGNLAEQFGFKVGTKSGIPEIGMILLREGLSLLQNPDSCPPLSPEFVRLRAKLHGSSGSYADEPGRVPAGQTVVGSMQQNDFAMKLLDGQASLISRLEKEIERLKGSPPGFRTGHHEEQSGGGAMAV